jgi:glycosyltransferase involved in cell wall biosynthesis
MTTTPGRPVADLPVDPLRILVVEDYVPDATVGSGYGRMIDTIADLRAMGNVHIALHPAFGQSEGEPRIGPEGVEVLAEPLAGHLLQLRSRGLRYDVVIVSRPHNYERVAPTLRDLLPGVPVIYDAEALYFRRLERQAALGEGEVRASLLLAAEQTRELEERIAREVDAVVCIAPEEAALLQRQTDRPVVVNGPLLTRVSWTSAGFADRDGIGFIAGWSAGPGSPNIDGLRWFARHIWPRVLARVPSARLLVTGEDPPEAVRRFETRSIQFLGFVPDLSGLYDRLRVTVVPIRYGSGVKLKAVESLQFGVPTVATTVGAEGIPIDVPGLIPVADDPGEFASYVARLHENQSEWETQRQRLTEQASRWTSNPQASIWPGLVRRLVTEHRSRRTVRT